MLVFLRRGADLRHHARDPRVLMVLFTITLGIVYAVERRVQPILIFAWAAVIVFGGLTLILQDEFFIKVRGTIYFGVLAAFLAIVSRWALFPALCLRDGLQARRGGLAHPHGCARSASSSSSSRPRMSSCSRSSRPRRGVPTRSSASTPLTVLFFIAQVPLITRHQAARRGRGSGQILKLQRLGRHQRTLHRGEAHLSRPSASARSASTDAAACASASRGARPARL